MMKRCNSSGQLSTNNDQKSDHLEEPDRKRQCLLQHNSPQAQNTQSSGLLTLTRISIGEFTDSGSIVPFGNVEKDKARYCGGSRLGNFLSTLSTSHLLQPKPDTPPKVATDDKDVWSIKEAIAVIQHFKDDLSNVLIKTKNPVGKRVRSIPIAIVCYWSIGGTPTRKLIHHSSSEGARDALVDMLEGKPLSEFLMVVSRRAKYEMEHPSPGHDMEAIDKLLARINKSLQDSWNRMRGLELAGILPGQLLQRLNTCTDLSVARRCILRAKYLSWMGQTELADRVLDIAPMDRNDAILALSRTQHQSSKFELAIRDLEKASNNEATKKMAPVLTLFVVFHRLGIIRVLAAGGKDPERQLVSKYPSGEDNKTHLQRSIAAWENALAASACYQHAGFARFTALLSLSALKYGEGPGKIVADQHLDEINQREWTRVIYFPFVNDQWVDEMYTLHREQSRLDLTCVVWTPPQSGESTLIRETLESKLRELNEDSEVAGVCVISPLPKDLGHIDLGELFLLLDEKKDVEGLRNGSRENVLAICFVDYLDRADLSGLSPTVVITRPVDMLTQSFIDTLSVRKCSIKVLEPNPAKSEDKSRAIWNDDMCLLPQCREKFRDIVAETMRQLEEWKGQNTGKSLRIGLVIDREVPPNADIYIDLEYHRPGESERGDSDVVMLDGYPVWPAVNHLTVQRAGENATS
ncbi:hypothetical protein FALBO_10572 [Fusarium albosuccineum]|uniref:Uncharacterized protein n=1 Tax=Fusarium albosuccineum TaxID=1237068 RepID=A0A8H4L5R4_9HYPO|nr:hypothetical protein FALBO_10572 [Fusarium albosuccineum]